MVAIADLDKIFQLNTEADATRRAIEYLGGGGHIVSWTVEEPQQPDGPGSRQSAMVMARDMPYPAQMVTEIMALLDARLQQINDELRQLGITEFSVTGVGAR